MDRYGKPRHFKPWEAEYETWPDEQWQIRAKECERSAQNDLEEVTNELKVAKVDLRRAGGEALTGEELCGIIPP